jgi:hypothetical protein
MQVFLFVDVIGLERVTPGGWMVTESMRVSGLFSVDWLEFHSFTEKGGEGEEQGLGTRDCRVQSRIGLVLECNGTIVRRWRVIVGRTGAELAAVSILL